MELELGLKITRTGEESTSTDLRIAKDRTGPVFFSTETEKMFILTVHLKGFKREKIKIEINEEGTRIAISGEKPVREMVLVRWKMYQKETEIVGFRKVFRIPNGVRLDRIKAKFDEEESILTIFMPKSVKGIVGIGIEEMKEEAQEIVSEKSEQTPPMERIAVTDETNLTQNSPQREPEQPITESEQQHYPTKETPIRTPEITVDYETEEIIPTTERIQESTGNEMVSELESKPPDSPPGSKETMQQQQEEQALALQQHQTITEEEYREPEITEQEPNPQQQTAEQIKSEPEPEPEPEPDRAVEPPEESIQQEQQIQKEIGNENAAEHQEIKEEAPVRAEASDQQNLQNEEKSESDGSEEEEEEEEERRVESKRGFVGPYIYAGSAALIGLLIVLVIKLLKKRKFKRKR